MEISVPDYVLSEKIYESGNSLVFRGSRKKDGMPVILKMLREDYPSPERIAWFRREYEITRNIGLPTVPVIYDLETGDNRRVMVMEDFGGDSLDLLNIAGSFLSRGDLKDFLTLALKITGIIGQIHQLHIIHKDINPSNIVLNQTRGEVKIIDFGISTVLSRENQTLCNPNVLEGTLAYISPEQTGRMNRAVDFRSDFYSLGVTLYELLTGHLPFQSDDPLEVVHCHIAKQAPAPLSETDRSSEPLISVISSIIMKLMAKNAEDRYQSAYGLKADLGKCLAFLSSPSLLTSRFSLLTEDVSDRFMIPQKLYGRSQQLSELLAIFDRAAAGEKLMMTVTGAPGVGKSALVQEVHKPVTEKRGLFISGKFDQYHRNIPFTALAQAFNQFCDHLLKEKSEKLAAWKKKILDAVGQNGQVLIDVIPHLEKVIGKQPEIPQVGFQESQNRFNLYFQYFIRAVSQPEHPLVIFIDDLQWADFASLNLIRLLMSDTQSRCLLMIGAYRDNEVGSGHPLVMTLDDIEKSRTVIHRIRVENLTRENLSELTADCLHCDLKKVKSLADLICEKTMGNAFFLIQFLTGLYDDGLLTFSREQGWVWNIENIRTKDITDNVAEFMSGKIRKLPDKTQEILKLASCLGSRFDVAVLAHIRERSVIETNLQVFGCVKEGLLIPLDDAYKLMTVTGEQQQDSGRFRFVHDRVRQAAYMLMDEHVRKTLHLKIGRILLKSTDAEELENRIFDIVGHLNLSMELIERPSEKIELARLNLLSGQKAAKAIAYHPAYRYFRNGMNLLPVSSWEEAYELTLNLHTEAMEAAYLCGSIDRMEQIAKIVTEHAKSLLDRVKVYEVRIMAGHALSSPFESVQTALTALKLLGIHYPENPDAEDFMQWLKKTREILGDKRIEDMALLPEMTDPRNLAIMRILTKVATQAYFAAPDLFPLLSLTQVQLSCQYGNAPSSPVGYAIFGAILCGIAGDIDAGCRFGELSLKLAENPGSREFTAMTTVVVYHLVLHWKQHLRKCPARLAQACRIALETGDLRYMTDAAHGYGFTSLYAGKELTELDRKMSYYSNVMRQAKQESSIHFHLHQIYHQTLLNLLGHPENPVCLIGDMFDEKKMLPFFMENKDRVTLFVIYLNKLILSYLFEDFIQAAENAADAETYLDAPTGLYHVPLFYFYDSLTRLALGNSEKVAANQEKMKKWAEHAPMNHLHKYYLVEAEFCRVAGKHGDAREYYDKAAALAKENEYIQEYALANELAGKFYLEKGLPKIAQIYLKDAHYAYQLWGAAAKVSHFEKCYASFFKKEESAQQSKTGSSQATPKTFLDIASIVKASQAISGEIVLRDLLTRLMSVMIENAGAQKGFLLLAQDSHLYIEAEADTEGKPLPRPLPEGEGRQYPPSPSERGPGGEVVKLEHAGDRLSQSVVNYVFRTRSSVVLNDAANEGDFTSDAYIIRYRPKSLLCLPIIGRGQCLGILYLENNLTTHGFPKERLEILSILASQAAISIENARLYANLEERVRRRTAELAVSNEKLKQSEELFSTFMDFLPSPIFIKDENSRTLYINRCFEEYFGKDWIGKTAADLFPEELSLAMLHDDRIALTQGMKQSIETIPAKSGENRIFQTTKFRIEHSGTYARIGGFGMDITELKQTEAELKKAKEKAETADRAKSTFLAAMSHELRTPLHGILGYAQILRNDPSVKGRAQDGLNVIEQSGKHLFSLINDILDLAKIESGRVELYESEFHLPLFLRDVGDIIRVRAEQKGIEFVSELSENLPVRVRCDERRLRQVLLNLLGNAVKFTDKGNVRFEVRGSRSGESGTPRTPNPVPLTFEITDTGIGISPEDLEKIFDPFQQAGDLKRRAEGTGLGLAISRNLVKLMGGTLNAESQPGVGSTFWFELELPEVNQEIGRTSETSKRIVGIKAGMVESGSAGMVESGSASMVESGSVSVAEPKILIVDDKPENRMVFRDMLAPLGFETAEAADGNEGLVKAEEFQPDAVITDLIMPGTDGFELIRGIRRHPALKNTPVIASSASVYEEDRRKSTEAGADAFVPKPLEADRLFELLQHLLKIQWLYEASADESGVEKEAAAFVLPPPETLETLFELSETGDMEEILNHSDGLAQSDEKFGPFADRLRYLTKGFRLNEISRLIEGYLNQ